MVAWRYEFWKAGRNVVPHLITDRSYDGWVDFKE